MSEAPFQEEWIDQRLPVWVALSDLFLDTELQDAGYDHIARTIRDAGLSAQAAEAILMDEIAPVFVSNLFAPAGEWAGWPEPFVRTAVLTHLRRGWAKRWLAGRAAYAARGLFMDDWAEVGRRLSQQP